MNVCKRTLLNFSIQRYSTLTPELSSALYIAESGYAVSSLTASFYLLVTRKAANSVRRKPYEALSASVAKLT